MAGDPSPSTSCGISRGKTAKRDGITSSTVVRPLRQAALQTFVRAIKRARDDTIAHAELPERTSFPASKICARVATVYGQGQRMSARAVRAK
jgi:hypothetical protein